MAFNDDVQNDALICRLLGLKLFFRWCQLLHQWSWIRERSRHPTLFCWHVLFQRTLQNKLLLASKVCGIRRNHHWSRTLSLTWDVQFQLRALCPENYSEKHSKSHVPRSLCAAFCMSVNPGWMLTPCCWSLMRYCTIICPSPSHPGLNLFVRNQVAIFYFANIWKNHCLLLSTCLTSQMICNISLWIKTLAPQAPSK